MHRRAGAQDAGDERQGEAGHRLSRVRPRADRLGDAEPRPGAQGDDPAARPLARAHARAAAGGPLHPDPRGDPRPARLRPRRPSGRGTRVPRADHRRVQRHREGHRAGPRDGHRVRHERQARRGEVRHRRRRAVHGPRLRPPARLLRGHRRRHRRRGARADRGARTTRRGRSCVQYRDALDAMVLELVEKETLGKEDLERILGAGAQAAAAQHLRRVRQAHAERPAAGRDPAVAADERRQRRHRTPSRARAQPAAAATAPPGVFGPAGRSRHRHERGQSGRPTAAARAGRPYGVRTARAAVWRPQPPSYPQPRPPRGGAHSSSEGGGQRPR